MRNAIFLAVLLAIPCAGRAQQPTAPDTDESLLGALSQSASQNRSTLETQITLSPSDENVAALSVARTKSLPDVKVDLNLDNEPVRDALKQVFDQAKLRVEFEEDVPKDVRVSVKAKGVQFGTAVDLITQAAGIGWRSEMSGEDTLYRVGKKIRSTRMPIFWTGSPLATTIQRNAVAQDLSPFVYRLSMTEERSAFTCPYCKGTTTMTRVRQAAKCPKCNRTFQGDWQFCPVDGTRRPPSPGEWKFCPLCGKAVDVEKAETKR